MPRLTLARPALMISIGLFAAAGWEQGASARGQQPDLMSVDSVEGISAADLRAKVSDERARRFYESRDWRAAWTPENAERLSSALDEAERHGLRRTMFIGSDGGESAASRETALTDAAIAYAEALAAGRTDPSSIRDVYTVSRPKTDVVPGLVQAVGSGTIREWLSGLAPQDADYRTLSEAYLSNLRLAAKGSEAKIEAGGAIREGESDPRVPRIAELLASQGYLETAQGRPDPKRYTPEISAAIVRLQENFGIAADGVVGPDTIDVLNTGAADRARQLAVNLERRRWLERTPPATRIDVNIAAALLDYWREGSRVDHRKVVVGQAGWETPQLGSPIFRLVANPTWTVPKSIERSEFAGKGQAYLSRNNMERRNGWIVQLPGPDNALGEVKFDMRNRHAIYLHDTPAKQLFERSDRHRSHGCIRVEDALGFARTLAEADGKLERFEEALASGQETFVPLDRNVPVRLVYHSAFVGQDGAVHFHTDAYGWDEDVAKELGLNSRERRPVRPKGNEDVGP